MGNNNQNFGGQQNNNRQDNMKNGNKGSWKQKALWAGIGAGSTLVLLGIKKGCKKVKELRAAKKAAATEEKKEK